MFFFARDFFGERIFTTYVGMGFIIRADKDLEMGDLIDVMYHNEKMFIGG